MHDLVHVTPADTRPASLEDAATVMTEALSWPEKAMALKVTSVETCERAAEMLLGIKALRKKVAETFDPHIKRAYEAHRALCREKTEAEAPLTEAERMLKDSLSAYNAEQDRLRREEERRLQEQARREEEQRRLAEAAELEAQAVAEGNADLQAEAEAMIAAPIETPYTPVKSATPKVAGIAYTKTWKAECTDLRALIQAAAKTPQLAGLLMANQVGINGILKALKGDMNKIPGIRAWEVDDVRAGRR